MEYQEIISRRQEILSKPVRPVPADRLEKERTLFTERNRKSLEIFERAKGLIPGGVEHNLSQSKPFPLAMDRGKGYRMWDVDGNELIDYIGSWGPMIAGHAHPSVIAAIADALQRGTSYGAPTGLEVELAACEAMEGAGLVPKGVAGRIRDKKLVLDAARIEEIEKTTKHDVIAFRQLLASAAQPVLAFCRSGTRCTTLWAFASAGELAADDIIGAAARAGYDLSGLRDRL